MRYIYGLFFLALLACTSEKSELDPASYVNPFIGTAPIENHINGGNTYPGAVRPWGMASMNPHNMDFRDEVASTTYKKDNPYIYGFGHAHVSGMGCNASGAILLKATTGILDPSVDHTRSPYSNETAFPGYYSVSLDKFNVQAEFTTTEHSGISRFTFPEGKSNLMIDLGLTPDFGKSGSLEILSENSFQGHKIEGNTCGCEKWGEIYFYGEISKESISSGFFKDWEIVENASNLISGEYVGLYFEFDNEAREEIEVRVGISYVSIENAKQNLLAETKDLSFDEIQKESYEIWKKELSKVLVEGGSREELTKFYSALYHSLFHPNIISDVNGDYPLHERNGIGNSAQVQYTNFSMWDTYRTLHPLLNLVYPERQEAMIASLVQMYKESGWLPRIEVNGHNTGVMVGDPASIIINDAYQKGITNFDTLTALEAMTKSATFVDGQNLNRRGFRQYMQYGFIPQDKPGNDSSFSWLGDMAWGTVSSALEVNLADWNIAQYSRKMGNKELADKLETQSTYYKNNFDPEVGFFRARLSNGDWYEPFDPLEHSNTLFNRHMRGGPGFVEGCAWNYLFFVPHDIQGLTDLLGGEEIFVSQLQACFDEGYYDASNEPNIAFPFLFNYVEGEEWRSQKTVSDLIDNLFTADESGIPGNDDTGTMSAWLVFAMMGIYPDCPGDTDYQIVKPSFEKVVIKLNEDYYPGKEFTIRRTASSPEDSYIRSMSLNDSRHDDYSINHWQIAEGGELYIRVGEK